MTENHSFPITPPPELIEQWMQDHATKYDLARHAAQWGADQGLRDLRTRIETLEVALHKHIMQTSFSTATSKALDISDLPQWTPKQVQNLQDLLGTYRNHLGLNN
jgi:hypothetical protein